MKLQHSNLLDGIMVVNSIDNLAIENNHLFLIVSGVLEN